MPDDTPSFSDDAPDPDVGDRSGMHAWRASPTELDQLIHSRVRLGIISALAAAGGRLGFTDLRDLLDTSDGNLSVHARKLEEAGYVTTHKSFDGRTPKTEYALTDQGREAFTAYVDHMEHILSLSQSGDDD